MNFTVQMRLPASPRHRQRLAMQPVRHGPSRKRRRSHRQSVAELYRDFAFLDVARAQVMNGDIPGAVVTTQRIGSPYDVWMLTEIAEAQLEAGDTLGASNSIAKAIQAVSRIPGEEARAHALVSNIAWVQSESWGFTERLKLHRQRHTN